MLREKIKWRPRLRTILFIVNLTVLLLPLGSIYFFRFYENELVRQTESELIAQGSFIAEIYKKEMRELVGEDNSYGISPYYKPEKNNEYYQPIPALLNLSSANILPQMEPPLESKIKTDTRAIKVGTELSKILTETSKTTLAGIRVTDYKGIIVASSRNEIGLNYGNALEVQTALQGKYTSIIRKRISDEPYPALASISRGTGIRIFVGMPIILENKVIGTVLLSRSPRSILKALNDRQETAIMLLAALFAIVILLTIFTSYTINNPIHGLIDRAKRITKGEKNVDIKTGRRITKEIGLLSDSISTMAETIQQRSEYIRNFANAVSHEFKTPLTSIGGTIELLQEHVDTMPLTQRQRFFNIIAQDTIRLRKLVTRLLELAKADITTPTDTSTNLSAMLPTLKERYKNLGLTLKINNEGAEKLRISPEVVETVLTNIFNNSLQHKATEVIMSINQQEDKSIITITDNGKGISPANRNKIFDPFFTTNRETGGTGLGLSIVKSLLNAHDGDIWVNDSEGGASFSLRVNYRLSNNL